MKSLKKQAIFPVLALLVVTALALIGSSFAWFAMTNVASVGQIDATVEEGSTGLMISQDAANYYGSITLGGSATTYIHPTYLHQVSTNGTVVTNGGLNFFQAAIVTKDGAGKAATIKSSADATIDYNEAGTASQATGKTASYYVFDLYFQVDSACSLYLNLGTEFKNAATLTALSAMRCAFINLGNVAVTGVPATDTAAATALHGTGSIVIWEPVVADPKVDTYGVAAASGETPFNAYESATTYAPTAVTTKSTAELVLTTDQVVASQTTIATLVAGINKVRVIMWVEGNDPDCVVSIAKAVVNLTLKFYAKASA